MRGDVNDNNTATPATSAQHVSNPKITRAQQLAQREPATTSESPLSFFSLPGEVRNIIYHYLTLPTLTTITVSHANPVLFSLPIFHVSHQIRDEATSYLLVHKTIRISGMKAANAFFNQIGDKGMRNLRHVEIRCAVAWRPDLPTEKANKAELLNHLKLATGLQRLEVVVTNLMAPFGMPYYRRYEGRSLDIWFLLEMKDVVDGGAKKEEEGEMEERICHPSEEVGEEFNAGFPRELPSNEHTEQKEKVFGLRRLVGNTGQMAPVYPQMSRAEQRYAMY